MSSGNGESLLIQRIKEGEEYAFEIAFLKYYTPLCRYIWKYVRTEDLAREIVQEVFTTVWETRENLDPAGHLRGLLFEAARNKALDYIKHQKIVDRYLAEAKRQREKNIYKNIYPSETDYSAFRKAAEEAINNLPPKARRIYKLNRQEGLTYREISEYLDISVKTVESHMRRVLQILRDRLGKYIPILLLIVITLSL